MVQKCLGERSGAIRENFWRRMRAMGLRLTAGSGAMVDMKRVVVTVIMSGVLGVSLIGTAGCQTKAGTGALVGGAAGAGIGAIIGHNSHGRTASGAAIGGVVGAIGGALVGNEMDKADRAKERDRDREEAYRQRRDSRYESRAGTITRADVVAWSQRGDRDADVIDRIERSGTIFHLSSRDENQLRNAGVGEDVIHAMRDTAKR